jgi:hypothetical protein
VLLKQARRQGLAPWIQISSPRELGAILDLSLLDVYECICSCVLID